MTASPTPSLSGSPTVREPFPPRILLTGDVHGNARWLTRHVLRQAQRHDCPVVLQLGDFGIWPGADGRHFLELVNREYQLARVQLWFIDGNHEDFDQLYALPLNQQGLRPVREVITHVPRGYRFSWRERTILACGGAASYDRDLRVQGKTWWPQEQITEDDVERCVAGGAADVLITHDIQLEMDLTGTDASPTVPFYVLDAIRVNRLRLQRIVEAVRPSLQIHGHWHRAYDEHPIRGIDRARVRIVGLNCDTSAAWQHNGHCGVLDLAHLPDDVQGAFKVID